MAERDSVILPFSVVQWCSKSPWDEVVILKALVLQALYNLSDDQAEYQLRDRFSIRQHLRINLFATPAYDWVAGARASIGCYLYFYNRRRPHSSLDGARR